MFQFVRQFLLATMLFAAGCSVSQETAEDVLQDEGYENVEVTGHAWTGCSDDDQFRSSFKATRRVLNADGTTSLRNVEGTICCGWWKDCTVRH